MPRKRSGAGSDSLVCSICSRSFSRTEHRDRHMATHNVVRPYRCNFCARQFQRTDSLRRHVDRHCSQNQHSLHAANHFLSRVKKACDACHSKKLRCDGEAPCSKCSAKRQLCTYQRSAAPGLPDSPESIVPVDQEHASPACTDRAMPEFLETYLDDERPAAIQETDTAIHLIIDSTACQQSPPRPTPVSPPTLRNEHEQLTLSPELDTNTSNFTSLDSSFDWSNNALFDSLADASNDFFIGVDSDFFGIDHFMLQSSPNHVECAGVHLNHLAHLLDMEGFATQFNNQTSQWLQIPLIPRRYNLNMLNSLLGVFVKRVSKSFTSFQDFEITTQTLPEQIIAMAAVGSLFVNIQDSSRITRMLFSDSSRILHNFVGGFQKYPKPVSPSLIQALIACELFGFCGGHSRSRELSEAYHGALMEAIFSCELFTSVNISRPRDQLQRERLLSDIFLLEAYRTSLFQLKPILTPALFASRLPPSGTHQQVGNSVEWIARLLDQQVQMMLHPEELKSAPGPAVQKIALISIASWFTQGRRVPSSYESVGRLWEPDTVHKSVDTYVPTLSKYEDASSILLAHMIVISMHTPLSDIYEAAAVTMAQKLPRTALQETLRAWRLSFDINVAMEHASQLLNSAATVISALGPLSTYTEGPHDAICILNAALVFWVSKSPCFGSSSGPLTIPEMDKAAAILMRLQLSAAATFSQALSTINQSISTKP